MLAQNAPHGCRKKINDVGSDFTFLILGSGNRENSEWQLGWQHYSRWDVQWQRPASVRSKCFDILEEGETYFCSNFVVLITPKFHNTQDYYCEIKYRRIIYIIVNFEDRTFLLGTPSYKISRASGGQSVLCCVVAHDVVCKVWILFDLVDCKYYNRRN